MLKSVKCVVNNCTALELTGVKCSMPYQLLKFLQ